MQVLGEIGSDKDKNLIAVFQKQAARLSKELGLSETTKNTYRRKNSPKVINVLNWQQLHSGKFWKSLPTPNASGDGHRLEVRLGLHKDKSRNLPRVQYRDCQWQR